MTFARDPVTHTDQEKVEGEVMGGEEGKGENEDCWEGGENSGGM